jgi:hypothetical protein
MSNIVSVSQSDMQLLKALEDLYPANTELKIDAGELRWGKLCPGAEKTIEFLKDRTYTALLVSFTDALLFLELIFVKPELISGISVEPIATEIRKLGDICELAKRLESIIFKQLTKLENMSYYSDIPDIGYPRRHRILICAKMNPFGLIMNLSFVIGGLAFIYRGFRGIY